MRCAGRCGCPACPPRGNNCEGRGIPDPGRKLGGGRETGLVSGDGAFLSSSHCEEGDCVRVGEVKGEVRRLESWWACWTRWSCSFKSWSLSWSRSCCSRTRKNSRGSPRLPKSRGGWCGGESASLVMPGAGGDADARFSSPQPTSDSMEKPSRGRVGTTGVGACGIIKSKGTWFTQFACTAAHPLLARSSTLVFLAQAGATRVSYRTVTG